MHGSLRTISALAISATFTCVKQETTTKVFTLVMSELSAVCSANRTWVCQRFLGTKHEHGENVGLLTFPGDPILPPSLRGFGFLHVDAKRADPRASVVCERSAVDGLPQKP